MWFLANMAVYIRHLVESPYAQVSLAFATALAVYMAKQLSTPLLFGIDGPYYYVQVSHILPGPLLRSRRECGAPSGCRACAYAFLHGVLDALL